MEHLHICVHSSVEECIIQVVISKWSALLYRLINWMKRRERQWSTTHRYQSVCFMAPLIFSLGLSFIFTFSSLAFPSRRPDTCPTWCIPCASVEQFSLWPTYAKRGEPIIKFISSLLNLSLLKSCQTSHLCQPPLKSHLLKILVRSECFLHFSLAAWHLRCLFLKLILKRILSLWPLTQH